MSLTGGSGDVNPQYFTMQVVQTAADTFTQTQFPIPIQRMPSRGSKAQVMEILRVLFQTADGMTSSAGGLGTTITAQVTTKSQTAPITLAEPTLVAICQKATWASFTAGGTGYAVLPTDPYVLDLSDNAGHGLLVATDYLYFGVGSTSTGLANTCSCKVLYRWKNVSEKEYVGIVQSQS